jgi:hypothetical protein
MEKNSDKTDTKYTIRGLEDQLRTLTQQAADDRRAIADLKTQLERMQIDRNLAAAKLEGYREAVRELGQVPRSRPVDHGSMGDWFREVSAPYRGYIPR